LKELKAGMPKNPNQPLLREGVFKYDGRDTWQIGLTGRPLIYRNVLGLHQIQWLLQRPKQRVSIFELAEVGGQKIVINQPCTQPIMDGKASAQYRQELEELEDKIEMANQTGNFEKIGQFEAEVAALKRPWPTPSPTAESNDASATKPIRCATGSVTLFGRASVKSLAKIPSWENTC